MAKKISGFEWKQFLNDTAYWESYSCVDDTITVNGEVRDSFDDNIQDNAIITIEDGGLVFIDHGNFDDCDKGYTLRSFFNRWRKLQTTSYIVIAVQNENIDAVKESVKAAGGKIC